MDQDDVLTLVYIVLGAPSTDILSNDIVNHFIDQWEVIYPLATEGCMAAYKTVISCAEYLYGYYTANDPYGSAGGSRMEKNGSRQIQVTVGESSTADTWQTWLDNFLRDPVSLMPCLQSVDDFNLGSPIITGINKDDYINTLANSNNLGNGARIRRGWNSSQNKTLDRYSDGYFYSSSKRNN